MRLLKIREVVSRTGVPISSIYWRITRGEFPRPVKLGERASAWVETDVDAWIAQRIAATKQAAV